ncbi:MAG: Enoyl-CoA hydratase/isomerase [Streptosporangiaceae bacterium]|nr:Enoyl-CoA hydratase/isomerase [Streptosporangiaceae bacterium]
MHFAQSEAEGLEVTFQEGGQVALLTINRPAARNALSSGVVAALGETMQTLHSHESVRVVVLTGAPPGFCAGSDLKELAGMSISDMATHEARTGQFVRSMQHLAKPVIAAVEGFALGGGFLLATGCDLVVTAENARWHLPEVALGWVPPWGLQTLVARVGPATGRRLAWGDRPLTGADLHRLGVADEVVAPGAALESALDLARRLAALPPAGVASTKRALSDVVVGAAETLDARATRLFAQDCESDSAQASLAKFARKTSKESR